MIAGDTWIGRGFDRFLVGGLDRLYGPSVRRVSAPAAARALYLTFDDGPDPRGTPRVLELLAEFGARATFFVIADRARRHPELVREMRARGHAIGNHSPDHRYGRFFGRRERLREWIAEGEREIATIAGAATVGFRPPLGMRTPELVRAAGELGTPIILWETRFFDTVAPPSADRMTRTLETARSGDIVLLHDSQREANLELFLVALRAYLDRARSRDFTFLPLERSLFHVRGQSDPR